MIHLVQGDRYPMVAVVQTLLNTWNLRGNILEVDSVFGRYTRDEVTYFQQQQGIMAIGEVRQNTWQKLTEIQRLDVRDLVDTSDSLLNQASETLINGGATPLEIGRVSNATASITSRVVSSGIQRGSLVLLRFHGHGNRGSQVIGYGTGCHVFYETFRPTETMPALRECAPARVHPSESEAAAVGLTSLYSGLSNRSLDVPEIVNTLRPLRDYFSPYGSIEFHGCHVGDGRDGRRFLRRISNLFGVPASGAHTTQHTVDAIRYTGPVQTAYPNEGNLESWARQLTPL
jgi:hypothetical protein